MNLFWSRVLTNQDWLNNALNVQKFPISKLTPTSHAALVECILAYYVGTEVEYPEKIAKLFVDSEKIAWVLTNLLSNAIHYSKENSRIIIGAQQTGDVVEMFVQDFGKGIDPRYHESIFDRYFRVPGTKVQGSGLGLSISKDFIEAQNGTLTVESEVGKGSKFIIRFNVK